MCRAKAGTSRPRRTRSRSTPRTRPSRGTSPRTSRSIVRFQPPPPLCALHGVPCLLRAARCMLSVAYCTLYAEEFSIDRAGCRPPAHLPTDSFLGHSLPALGSVSQPAACLGPLLWSCGPVAARRADLICLAAMTNPARPSASLGLGLPRAEPRADRPTGRCGGCACHVT